MGSTALQEFNPTVISPGSRESIGVQLANLATSPGFGAWPLSNLALFVPVTIFRPWQLLVMGIENGATVSGAVDVGFYDNQGNRIVSIGSSSQTPSGPDSYQTFDVVDTVLEPGQGYIAMAMNNGTGQPRRWNPAVPIAASCGVLEMASAFPLPATATFAACTRAYIPLVAMFGRTVV